MQLFGTAGQAKLFCPGTKGQRDRSSFIVPGQRDNGTSSKSCHGTGRDFKQALPSQDVPGRPGTKALSDWQKKCQKKSKFVKKFFFFFSKIVKIFYSFFPSVSWLSRGTRKSRPVGSPNWQTTVVQKYNRAKAIYFLLLFCLNIGNNKSGI